MQPTTESEYGFMEIRQENSRGTDGIAEEERASGERDCRLRCDGTICGLEEEKSLCLS